MFFTRTHTQVVAQICKSYIYYRGGGPWGTEKAEKFALAMERGPKSSRFLTPFRPPGAQGGEGGVPPLPPKGPPWGGPFGPLWRGLRHPAGPLCEAWAMPKGRLVVKQSYASVWVVLADAISAWETAELSSPKTPMLLLVL